jgi:lysozyme
MPTPSVIALSHWQGPAVDFRRIAESGIIGVVHKITEGSGVYDAQYGTNRSNATAAGLAWGAYHFLRPGDMDDQADFFLKYAKPDHSTVLVADHEDAGVSLDDLKRFLAALRERTGVDAVIWSGAVIKQQLGDRHDAELARHRLWLSYHTTGAPIWPTATWPRYWLWQFSDEGIVPGVDDCKVELSAFGPAIPFVWAGARAPVTA